MEEEILAQIELTKQEEIQQTEDISRYVYLRPQRSASPPDEFYPVGGAGQAIRAINATLSIQAPRWWWVEMDTYDVGVIKLCGESTMHTDCKGMKELS